MLPQSRTGGPGRYKYILFAFSGKGGSLPPDGSKQNKTGFSQAAKSSEGWGGRTLGTDPGNWCTCPLRGTLCTWACLPTSCPLATAPAPSSCPHFLWPGRRSSPSSLPPPIRQGHTNNLPKEDSALTPSKATLLHPFLQPTPRNKHSSLLGNGQVSTTGHSDHHEMLI